MTVPTSLPGDREHGREEAVQEGPAQREAAAERLARRLDRPIGALGLVFLLVIIGQSLAESPALRSALTIAGWLMWTVFVAELGLRAWVAPDRRRFSRRNWWQVVFLAVPVFEVGARPVIHASCADHRCSDRRRARLAVGGSSPVQPSGLACRPDRRRGPGIESADAFGWCVHRLRRRIA